MNVVLDEMDLNALVRERLDIDALASDLDIEAVINRVDLIALADRVIEGVDLPAIIRESTNSMTAEVMTDVRTQGERADDVIAGIVDRMLGVTGTTGDPIGTAARRAAGGRDHHPGTGRGHRPAGGAADHGSAVRGPGVGEARSIRPRLSAFRR